MTEARGSSDRIQKARRSIDSRVYVRAASFTSSCSFGLPFGFPLDPLGNGLPRGFGLRLADRRLISLIRPSSRLRQVEVRLVEQHVAQARGRPGCKAEPASNDIRELWPRNSSEAGELSLRQASALHLPVEEAAEDHSNGTANALGFSLRMSSRWESVRWLSGCRALATARRTSTGPSAAPSRFHLSFRQVPAQKFDSDVGGGEFGAQGLVLGGACASLA